MQGGPRNLTLAVAGSALQESRCVGTETFVNEAAELLVPSVGSATITIGGGVHRPGAACSEISNQVDKNEQRLFNFERGDLQPLGLDCAFVSMAIDVDADLYAEFHMNNATTDAPAPASIPGPLSSPSPAPTTSRRAATRIR